MINYNYLSESVGEIYTYMLMREIADESPGYYDDINRSVSIDWDGTVYDRSLGVSDTKNEIDVMATRDLVPIFISCKNGDVDKSALYELDTVAERFGGKYAKKELVTAGFLDKHHQKRAEEMDILVTKV